MFRIEDGAIVGGPLEERVAHSDFLCTTQTYEESELRLEVKLLGEGAAARPAKRGIGTLASRSCDRGVGRFA